MDLDQLRNELDQVDEKLIRLAARRQRLVKKIGRVKRTSGKKTRDFKREKDVIEGVRRVAMEEDVSPDLAEQLIKLLIESSLTEQEQDQVAAQAQGHERRALIIGGGGRMGLWFAEFVTSQGYAVEIADPAGVPEGYEGATDWKSLELTHDLILVAAPLRASARILHELAEHRPSGVVCDIGSLKSPLEDGLHALREAGVSVTSIHPMFGPEAQLLSGRHVVFINLGDDEATEMVRDLFHPTMAKQVEMTLEEHDVAMAFVLGLSHATNLAFVEAMRQSGLSAEKLASLSSTTFDAQLGIAEQVFSENPHLYFEIQALNSSGVRAVDVLVQSAESLKQSVEDLDEPAFVEVMRKGNAYLSNRSSIEAV